MISPYTWFNAGGGTLNEAVRPEMLSTRGGERIFKFFLMMNCGVPVLVLTGLAAGAEAPFAAVPLLLFNLLLLPLAAAVFLNGNEARERTDKTHRTRRIVLSVCGNIALQACLYACLIAAERHGCAGCAGTLLFYGFPALQLWNIMNLRGDGGVRSVFLDLPDDPVFLAGAVLVVLCQWLAGTLGGTFFHTGNLSFTDKLSVLGISALPLWIGECRRAYAFYCQSNRKEQK